MRSKKIFFKLSKPKSLISVHIESDFYYPELIQREDSTNSDEARKVVELTPKIASVDRKNLSIDYFDSDAWSSLLPQPVEVVLHC